MASFFANTREGPRAKLRKKSIEDQAVDNNTYTPNAVLNRVKKPALQQKNSVASLSSINSAMKAQQQPPSSILSQLSRTTRTLMNMDNKSTAALAMNIGNPKFVKRNDSPIYRFPSQKEQLLIDGTEKLVRLEGDVIPGPGVKPKDEVPEQEPEVVQEETKRVLKVVNLPDPEVKPAFEEWPRVPTPPPKPLPLAASRPVPIRQVAPEPTELAPLVLPAQIPKPQLNFRGLAAFRFGGSIPGPSQAPKDSEPLEGIPVRSNTMKPPATKVSRRSPLSEPAHPNIPTSPPHATGILTHATTSPPTKLSTPIIPVSTVRPQPNYRGVAAFRFGGSIPGPSAEPKDSRPLPGILTRSNTMKPPAIRVLRASPLYQVTHPNIPTSPSSDTGHLTVSQSWHNQSKKTENAGINLPGQHRRVKEVRFDRQELAQAPYNEARDDIASRQEVEGLHHQNTVLHNRMHLLEEKTSSDKRMLLNRIIALEKANLSVIQHSRVQNSDLLTVEFSSQNGTEDKIIALKEQKVRLEKANEELTARIADLELQREDLITKTESFESELKKVFNNYANAKEESETIAGNTAENTVTLLATIEALEQQNSLDRKRGREEKEAIQQQVETEQARYAEEIANLRERLDAQEIECAKHLQDLRSKDEELSSSRKEKEALQKEIKVLWEEIGKLTKKTDSDNAKKIADLELKLAAAAKERASAAVIREKLKKETEVLWAEIRDMHEKQATRIGKTTQGRPPSAHQASAKSNATSASVPDKEQLSPPQSPQLGVTKTPPLPVMKAQMETPAAPQVVKHVGRPGTPIPLSRGEAPNQPDYTAALQMGFSSLRRRGSDVSLRFRQTAMISTEATSPTLAQKSPTSPTDRSRFGYTGPPRRKRASSRAWRPPGT